MTAVKNDTAQYRQWIIAAAQDRSVPSDLALAVARQESRLQHYWQSGPHAGEVKISPKGAIGIMQVEPYNAGGRNLYDPKQNIEAGVAYLALMFQTFNSWPLAVAAYDAGEGRVSGWLKGINTLPRVVAGVAPEAYRRQDRPERRPGEDQRHAWPAQHGGRAVAHIVFFRPGKQACGH